MCLCLPSLSWTIWKFFTDACVTLPWKFSTYDWVSKKHNPSLTRRIYEMIQRVLKMMFIARNDVLLSNSIDNSTITTENDCMAFK